VVEVPKGFDGDVGPLIGNKLAEKQVIAPARGR